MTSIQALLPTLREHQRYLAFEVMSASPVRPTELRDTLQRSLLQFLGEAGYGMAGVQFIETHEQGGIIRMNADAVDHVRCGLMMAREVNGQRIAAKSVRVSGMLHTARQMKTV